MSLTARGREKEKEAMTAGAKEAATAAATGAVTAETVTGVMTEKMREAAAGAIRKKELIMKGRQNLQDTAKINLAARINLRPKTGTAITNAATAAITTGMANQVTINTARRISLRAMKKESASLSPVW